MAVYLCTCLRRLVCVGTRVRRHWEEGVMPHVHPPPHGRRGGFPWPFRLLQVGPLCPPPASADPCPCAEMASAGKFDPLSRAGQCRDDGPNCAALAAQVRLGSARLGSVGQDLLFSRGRTSCSAEPAHACHRTCLLHPLGPGCRHREPYACSRSWPWRQLAASLKEPIKGGVDCGRRGAFAVTA